MLEDGTAPVALDAVMTVVADEAVVSAAPVAEATPAVTVVVTNPGALAGGCRSSRCQYIREGVR